MSAIYRYYEDCGRMGVISGTFLAPMDQMDFILAQKDLELYIGDYLGKHSDVVLTNLSDYTSRVTEDEHMVAMFGRHQLSCGLDVHDKFREWAMNYSDEPEDYDSRWAMVQEYRQRWPLTASCPMHAGLVPQLS